jgi:glyceraldehyde-3-phosphate dehydrogenase/erythrose-4-phosphate dehydrogenase
MRKLLLAIALCSALTSPMLLAASKDTTTAQSSSKSQSSDTAAFDKSLAQLQEQMKIMQTQMDQIRSTQDPQERQKLLQQHWATMQSAMSTMHGMWGPGMMGYGRMGPGMI